MLMAMAADPLPAARTPAGRGNWTGLAGVPDHLGGSLGSGPRRTTIFATHAAGTAFATIQSSVTSCPSNQVVLLGAGTHNFAGNRLNIYGNGVTVRGAGPQSTFIVNSDHPSVQIGNWQWWETEALNNPNVGAHTNWTAGYTAGTTNITIASAGAYSAGQLILLDLLTSTNESNYGNAQGGANASFNYSSIANPDNGKDRFYFQINRIHSKSGNDLALYEPLYQDFDSARDPEVWRFVQQPVVGASLEDLAVSDSIQMHVSYGCWVSNCVADVGNQHAEGCVKPHWSVRGTLEHNRIFGDIGVDNYGYETRVAAGFLVCNNISSNVNTGLNPSGSHGSVWAYNVMKGQVPFFDVILQGLLQHGGNPYLNLYEGNYCPAIGLDNTWGTSAYNTAHRNRAIGYNPADGTNHGYQHAFVSSATNRHASSIGNMLGTTGLHTAYESYPGSATPCNNTVYNLGFWDVGCASPTDAMSRSTLIRAYNWTSATSTNSGIVLDGYAAGDIPASYYYTSKPSWFGTLTWPAVDPAQPTYSDSYTNIPSGYRATFNADPPQASGTAQAALTGNARLGGTARIQ